MNDDLGGSQLPVAAETAEQPILTREQVLALFVDRLAEYRKLKVQADQLTSRMEGLKVLMRPTVEAIGGWQDSLGYAKMQTRASAPTFPSADVEKLYLSWVDSADPIMQSCGTMLHQLRKFSAGSTYLQVK